MLVHRWKPGFADRMDTPVRIDRLQSIASSFEIGIHATRRRGRMRHPPPPLRGLRPRPCDYARRSTPLVSLTSETPVSEMSAATAM